VSELERGLGPAQLAQREELRPPGQRETPVAPAGAGAADIGLDDGDARARVPGPQLEGGPQSGEAASDDADVRVLRSDQARVLMRGGVGQRLREPQRAAGTAAEEAVRKGDGGCVGDGQ
jgi:hypothetical protein